MKVLKLLQKVTLNKNKLQNKTIYLTSGMWFCIVRYIKKEEIKMTKDDILYFAKWDLLWLIPASYEDLKNEVLSGK